MVKYNVIIVTQARIGSTRLPNKVLRKIGDTSLLDIHLERLKMSKCYAQIIVATTFETGVEKIIEIAKAKEVNYFQGSTEDVLDRFYNAVKDDKPEYVVRVTSDCPLIDPSLLDQVIKWTIKQDLDYCSNQISEQYPDGQDIEVFKFSALEKAWQEAEFMSEREHVTPFIRKNSKNQFQIGEFPSSKNYSDIRMTVDDEKDFLAINKLIEHLGINATWLEYTNYIIKNPDEFVNQKTQRNEGYLKSLKNDAK